MQKEYIFYDQNNLEFPLDESIEVVKSLEEIKSEYLVSNVQTKDTHIYAPEINYYIKNSQDAISQKIINVKKLYDIRGISCDFEQDSDFSQEVGSKIIVICEEDTSDLKESLEKMGFTVMVLNPSLIIDIKGHISSLNVNFLQDNEELEIITDQLIWFDIPETYTQKVGIYDPVVLGLEKVIKIVESNLGEYCYKSFIEYDSEICQYHERREEICTDCVKVCPSGAIVKNDNKKHLEFSNIDCISCGRCITVCPSGALDFVQMPREAVAKMSDFYKGSTALVLSKNTNFEKLGVELPSGVLPFIVEAQESLHEASLITLLQTSGNPVILYADFLSEASLDVIRIINEIFERKYKKKAIFACQNRDEIKEAFKLKENLNECQHGINQEGMNKRDIFSARLAHLVGDEDLGKVVSGSKVHYGNLIIDEEKCTLCFSCIGACNVKALTAHPKDNSLRLNPSICTTCGYCVVSCPEEGCITVVKDELSLNPSYFVQNIMAQDDLFECIECGKEFATVKSVEKIAAIMKPLFGNDAKKIAALYCCAECKPKVMFKDSAQKAF